MSFNCKIYTPTNFQKRNKNYKKKQYGFKLTLKYCIKIDKSK